MTEFYGYHAIPSFTNQLFEDFEKWVFSSMKQTMHFVENWEPTPRCHPWRFQPSSRQLRIWSTCCPCKNKWLVHYVKLNFQSQWRSTNLECSNVSEANAKRFLQCFMLRMLLQDRVSALMFSIIFGMSFGKKSNFSFGGRKICCAMHTDVCMLACPWQRAWCHALRRTLAILNAFILLDISMPHWGATQLVISGQSSG